MPAAARLACDALEEHGSNDPASTCHDHGPRACRSHHRAAAVVLTVSWIRSKNRAPQTVPESSRNQGAAVARASAATLLLLLSGPLEHPEILPVGGDIVETAGQCHESTSSTVLAGVGSCHRVWLGLRCASVDGLETDGSYGSSEAR